jgi:acetyltransferase-like isoleucine patch superfamily enzyme
MFVVRLIDRLSSLFLRIKSYTLNCYLKAKYRGKIQLLRSSSFGKNFALDIKADNFLLKIGNSSFKNYGSINIREGGNLIIGDGVTFNSFCTISCLDQITIGDNTLFGSNIYIYDHDHRYRDANLLVKDQGYTCLPITIGENCWIGANVTILKGVSIGSNSVIGAGIVVYENVAENTLLINNQAKISKIINRNN